MREASGTGLSGEDVVYLFFDGVKLGIRQGFNEKETLLIAPRDKQPGLKFAS